MDWDRALGAGGSMRGVSRAVATVTALAAPLLAGAIPAAGAARAGHAAHAGQAAQAGHAAQGGIISTVAGNGTFGFSGDGGPATRAELGLPSGVTVDRAGNTVIADSGNNAVRVTAASTGTFYRQAMVAGNIYTVAGTGVSGFSGDGGLATKARLSTPAGVATDGAGDLAIADEFNNRVRVVAARTGTLFGRTVTAGHIYTIAGGGRQAGNGIPGTSANVVMPGGVTIDSAGNTIIAATGNDKVRVVADRTGTFYDQAMTAGDIYTIAGGGTLTGNGVPATSAFVDQPTGVTLDGAGNLLISNGSAITVVAERTGTFYDQAMTAGDIYTVAGGGTLTGNGVPATSAMLNGPRSVAVDRAGNLVIPDQFNNRIRVVAIRTGTFYGQAMTAGDIYAVAGTGIRGFTGDGGSARQAELYHPSGVAVTKAGDLLIADYDNNRIRQVTASPPLTSGVR